MVAATGTEGYRMMLDDFVKHVAGYHCLRAELEEAKSLASSILEVILMRIH